MEGQKKVCPQCGQISAPQFRTCASCGATLIERAPQTAAPVERVPEPKPVAFPLPLPDQAPAVEALPKLAILPERMKADKVLAERNCSSCRQPLAVGDDVWNCQACGNSMHGLCHDTTQICGNPGCPTRPAAPVQSAAPGGSAAAPAGETVPCKFCGEQIRKGMKKCQFCNEYQTDLDRARMKSFADQVVDHDEKLGGVEIAMCFLCSGLATILGIVWTIQGKGKGWKVLVLSLVGHVTWAGLWVVAQHFGLWK